MKWGQTRTHLGTQELAKATDSASRHPYKCARLRDPEKALHQLTRELNTVQSSGDIALGRNCHVVIHGFLGPFMMEGKQKGNGCGIPCSKSAANGGNTGIRCYQKDASPGKKARGPITLDAETYGQRWRNSLIHGIGTVLEIYQRGDYHRAG